MTTLTPVDEALERILADVQPVVETVSGPLIESSGRVLAQELVSPIDVPGADNSAMDGYALRAADAESGPLPMSQRIPAGYAPEPLAPGTAARIFTGATVPDGADTVVMQENCNAEGDSVTVTGDVNPGQHIRRRGQDIAAGDSILSAGRRLRPQDLGLAASVGVSIVETYRPLRVAILSTGDELVEPGAAEPAPGQLYNSNRYTLSGLLSGLGMTVIDGGIVPDDLQATRTALADAADKADVIVSSGGVSVGEEDHVKAAVESLGELGLWKLAIKPGKPLAFGRVANTPFLGLPGNPSSVFVTFCLIARPFLLKRQGASDLATPSVTARAAFTVDRPGTRQEYLRATLSMTADGPSVNAFSNQSSGVLSSVSRSNALAVVPPGTTIAEGDPVEVLLLDLLTG